MSNKKDDNNHEHHPGKDGSYNGNKPYRGTPLYPPTEYSNAQEDEIDLIELAGRFWKDRKLIARITGAFVIAGIIIALFSAVEYKTGAVLMPQLQNPKSRAESLLGRYGGLLGIGRGTTASEGTLSPKLYPQIVQSVPYNLQLMNVSITVAEDDTTTTVYNYFQNIYSPSVLSYIKHYTLGLPRVILSLFRSDQPEQTQGANIQTINRDTVLNLTNKQWSVVKTLKNRVNVQVDQESGLVNLTAEMPDPVAAAQLAKAGIRILTRYVKEYRTEKAAQNLEFIQEQLKKAEQNFNNAQQQLAKFHDSNISVNSARYKTREQDLQSAYNLTSNLYNSLRQQLQQAQLRLQNQTPVVSILQPVTVPKAKSKPNRKLIVIVFLILGFIAALGWSLVRDYGKEIIREVREGKTSDNEEITPLQEGTHNLE